MKTSLKLLALFSTLALTGAAAADLTGVSLPAGIDTLDALTAFVVTLVTLIAFHDYAPRRPLALSLTPRLATSPSAPAVKSPHALAA